MRTIEKEVDAIESQQSRTSGVLFGLVVIFLAPILLEIYLSLIFFMAGVQKMMWNWYCSWIG